MVSCGDSCRGADCACVAAPPTTAPLSRHDAIADGLARIKLAVRRDALRVTTSALDLIESSQITITQVVESILNAYSAGKVIDYYAPLPQGIREELYFFSGFSDDNAAIRTEGALISQEGDCETFYIIAAARFTPSAASIARAAKMRDVQRARGDAQEDQSQTTNRSSD